MSDILCECAGEPKVDKFPCKAEDYGFINKVLGASTDATITIAGETPTVAEIQAAIAQSGVDKMFVIEEITNGQLVEVSRVEESGADTADGLTNTSAINMAVTGKVKKLNERVRADLLKLNCYPRVKMWYITSKGYIFGGKTGYRTANFIPPMLLPGFGTRAEINLNLVYEHNLKKTDPAGQDDGFNDIVNADIS